MEEESVQHKELGEISFIQHNCGKRKEAQATLLELAFQKQVDFVSVQEPAVWFENQGESFFSIQHSAYDLVLPKSTRRPRVACYIRKCLSLQILPKNIFAEENDVLVLEISGNLETFHLLNVYNEKALNPDSTSSSSGLCTVQRALSSYQPAYPTILVGDFNLHHTWWNRHASDSERAKARAQGFIQFLESGRFQLLNQPEVGTFYRRASKSRR